MNSTKRNTRNNFSKEQNKNTARYKLWMCFSDEAIEKKGYHLKTRTYYSYNTKPAAEQEQRLVELVRKHKSDLVAAKLFDNITGGLVQEWTKNN